ncbi:MAG TPA: hypothetical protein PK544_14270, partial [Spirochaetota bacterium]|nr:hypothetical protein [Spirochaetota bacterium]
SAAGAACSAAGWSAACSAACCLQPTKVTANANTATNNTKRIFLFILDKLLLYEILYETILELKKKIKQIIKKKFIFFMKN